MRLIEKSDGSLEYQPEAKDSAEDQAFFKAISAYKMKRQGAGVTIYNDRNELMAFINPFDNTQLIYHPEGFAVAKLFGAKRFPVGNAFRKSDEKETGAIKFPRDLTFPLGKVADNKIPFKVVGLKELLAIHANDQNKLYDDFAELFHRCADFTPGKHEEYNAGGKKIDKFCRFNLDNSKTDHVFLLDENNKMIGTISFVMSGDFNSIYFYDEIVDYFTKLTAEEKEAVHRDADRIRQLDELIENNKNDQLRKPIWEEERTDLKKRVAEIVDPKREKLMGLLFIAAQRYFQTKYGIDNISNCSGFIRAADGRVPMYEKLLGTNAGNSVYVIHGKPTDYLKMLDAHVKNWASAQLAKLAPKKVAAENPYLQYGKWIGLGALAAVAGVFVYRAYSKENVGADMKAAPTVGLRK